MCEDWTSARKRSATMYFWSNIAFGSWQTVVTAYLRRYESIIVPFNYTYRLIILFNYIFHHLHFLMIQVILHIIHFTFVDLTRQRRSISDYSGRFGGKSFLGSPYSLTVHNIGESDKKRMTIVCYFISFVCIYNSIASDVFIFYASVTI